MNKSVENQKETTIKLSFETPQEIKKFMEENEPSLYGGTNDKGEKIAVTFDKDTGIEVRTYQKNGWTRMNEYDQYGLLVGETFEGKHNMYSKEPYIKENPTKEEPKSIGIVNQDAHPLVKGDELEIIDKYYDPTVVGNYVYAARILKSSSEEVNKHHLNGMTLVACFKVDYPKKS